MVTFAKVPHPQRLADAVGVHPGRDILYVVPHQVWRQVARVLHNLCDSTARHGRCAPAGVL